MLPQTHSSKLKGSGNLQAPSSLPTFHSPASPNQPRRANPPSSSRNPSGSNTSQNQWINSSGRYPTGVGKPMHESSRASSPVKSSQSQDQTKNFCAWCHEMALPIPMTQQIATLSKRLMHLTNGGPYISIEFALNVSAPDILKRMYGL